MRTHIINIVKLSLILLLVTLVPFLNSCNNSDNNSNGDDDVKLPPPKSMGFSIVQIFPHDTSAYTQGITFYKGELYEGTGEYNRKSRLRKVDLKTGKVLKEIILDSMYFGEGITILNDTIYQLTYKEKVVFAYTLKDFKKVKEFRINTDGWGLTHDGKNLIATDGGSNLYYYDPSTFTLLKTQPVTESGNMAYNLNELEYIDGYIYANQYEMPYIIQIDPSDGKVVAKADITEIWNKIRSKDPRANVPNGIAYDPSTKKTYVTGKWWPELYEIQLSK